MGIRQLLRNPVIAGFLAVYGGFALVLICYSLLGAETGTMDFSPADFVVEAAVEGEDELSMEDYKGQHVLVYFFASW